MSEAKPVVSAAVTVRLKAARDAEWRARLRKSVPPRDRMAIERVAMPERPAAERVRDFDEVNLGLTPDAAVREARRCLDCAAPACVPGCPVAIDIPSFVKLIEAGDFVGAARKIREDNSLPAVCGRVCPQETQCEAECTLVKAGRAPVAIGHLERFAADCQCAAGDESTPEVPACELPSREPSPPPGTASAGAARAADGRRKVAIIGAGPAGLTAAGELAKLGHRVTVFEALHLAGGVLVYGIPEFRLPKSILETEISYLRRLGVEFRMNFVVGMTATIDDLRAEGFDAFFAGTGAGLPNFMKVPGESLVGIYSANEYLTRVNLMRAFEFPRYDTPVTLGRRAAVIGGGNVALDSVRTALRLGAESATIVYRRSRTEMPARAEEVHHAEQEGVRFHFLTVPTRCIGDGRGRVAALECLVMELGEPDASGRRRPIPVPGSEFTIEADLVVVAVGQSPNPLLSRTTPELRVGKWGNIEVDAETRESSVAGLYAGGDVVRGGATVILAMGDGRAAAAHIHERLRTKGEVS